MMDKFRVGQMVRLIKASSANWKPYVGCVMEITGPQALRANSRTGRVRMAYAYSCTDGAKAAGTVPEEFLAPLYDGDQKSSWSECAWKPSKVSA